MTTDGKPTKETLDNWHKDPNNWKWRWLYYNKEDKRIFPPKKNKIMGNNVLINKNAELNIKLEYFSFQQNGFEYKIYSSVKGVFNRVVNSMKNPNSETH